MSTALQKNTVVTIPDVSGLSLKDAALAYARSGIYVLPVACGKHPGSIVGKGWPRKSTTDPDQIERWWAKFPNAGIAIHTGPSGLTFFDLDRDTVPEELAWLKTGTVQFSRADGERGHYGFFTGNERFTSGDLKTSDGTTVGEIRSGNTVVIASPSPHVHAETKNARYRWRAGDVNANAPTLPDDAREKLRPLRTKKSGAVNTPATAVWAVEATDDALKTAIAEWTRNERPKPLEALVNRIKTAEDATRNPVRDALRIAASESRIGFYPLSDAVEKIRGAMIAGYRRRGELEKFDDVEYLRLVRNGVGYALSRSPKEISMEANRDYGTHHEDAQVLKFPSFDQTEETTTAEPIFRQFGPTDWAKPVPTTEFLIKRVLVTDTWGVNGGPEKSLKTHDNQAIGLAVATGTNLYNDARFTVERPGKVLYIVGEGGKNQVFRVLHRMCAAYGIAIEDVKNDSDFPFVVVFGAAPLDSFKLRDEIRSLLDEHQPSLVLMESFYNFHPDVNASNLYERGRVIDSYHKLVRAGGESVVSLLTDHNKKGANKLGLQQISMAGQAENSDSWIQRMHRKDPDVQTGDFWLTTSYNGRDWGGNTFDVDWHLGPFDHDTGTHTGHISWNVNDRKSVSSVMKNAQTKTQRKESDVISAIRQVLADAHANEKPGLNQKEMIDGVKKIVPDAGENLIRAKLTTGVEENYLISDKMGKSVIYALSDRHGEP